jgi:tRNA pseudouridine55 synthase
MATGLLVILVGDATRLATWATAEDKRYLATVVLGRGTDTLDAEGTTTEERPLAPEIAADLRAAVDAAVARELERTEQIPPAVSAIHVDGERAHELVRRGETPVLAPRITSARSIDVLAIRDGALPEIDVAMWVDKGYYVRSFARDLGAALGVPAHLSALRRTASGRFVVGAACACDPDPIRESFVPLRDALPQVLACVELTDEGALRARQGKRLSRDAFAGEAPVGVMAWTFRGDPVAIGEREGDEWKVVRGFP